MGPEISHRFFDKLEDDRFSFIYMGEFDDELTRNLTRISETSINDQLVFKKKISFLITECFQNIIRHSDKPEIINRTNNKPTMFSVRNIGAVFYIASTNLIKNDKKEELLSKLKSINKFSPEELKKAYLNALVTNATDKGGGGFGLIEMARKSGCRLEFDFEPINFFFSNFYLQLRVTVPQNDDSYTITIADTKELYKTMVEENILMIRRGDFSQQSILPLLELIKNSLNPQGRLPAIKKKTVYLLVELLQNISKHANEHKGKREGIFIIALENNRYTLNTGNYINTSDVESLKKELKNITSLDPDELTEFYKKNLLRKEANNNGSAGLGFIELSKYSSEKLKYNFKSLTDTVSFFSLSVTV